jgi:hypothetical protein
MASPPAVQERAVVAVPRKRTRQVPPRDGLVIGLAVDRVAGRLYVQRAAQDLLQLMVDGGRQGEVLVAKSWHMKSPVAAGAASLDEALRGGARDVGRRRRPCRFDPRLRGATSNALQTRRLRRRRETDGERSEGKRRELQPEIAHFRARLNLWRGPSKRVETAAVWIVWESNGHASSPLACITAVLRRRRLYCRASPTRGTGLTEPQSLLLRLSLSLSIAASAQV